MGIGLIVPSVTRHFVVGIVPQMQKDAKRNTLQQASTFTQHRLLIHDT
jgi:hypothetical protein